MEKLTFDDFRTVVAEQLNVDPDRVQPEASFVDTLEADSLDLVELMMALEEKSGVSIPDDEAEKIRTVGQAWSFVREHQPVAP